MGEPNPQMVERRIADKPIRFDKRMESRCIRCHRLLSKPVISIRVISITQENFDALMKGIELAFGTETMCRTCKRVCETLTVFKAEL